VQILQSQHADIQVLAITTNIENSIQAIKTHEPNLIFLDVELGNESSFTLLSQLPNLQAEIIFTTAFDKYALQAIKYSCLEYLLKPIDPIELKAAIEKLKQKRKSNNDSKRIELLLTHLQNPASKINKIAIPTASGFEFVNIQDIIYCQADSDYTWLFIQQEGKLLSSRTLKDFEKLLPEDIFFRSHKSYLVNMNCVKKYTRKEGDRLEMENGDLVEISVRKKDEFLSRISKL
ncbi:MAG: LytTR family DNA-binding domain-containing protein, partial [Cytophagales bacterium]|nr:LytTR family DNA-binding domain-containing protein [Cytophagales bacterium]